MDSYLSGSYSRDTALRPIDDVDIVFVVEPSHWTLCPSFWRPEPSEVLGSFARAIRHRYTLSSVYGQRRSVNLRLSNLDIDVVPALSANEHSSAIYVPGPSGEDMDSKQSQRTCSTSDTSKSISRWTAETLVKLLKLWNSQLPSTAQVKSFLLETMALRIFRRNEISSLEEGLVKFWDHMAYAAGEDAVFGWESVGIRLSWWSATVPDVAETGGDVAGGLDSERRQKFVQ